MSTEVKNLPSSLKIATVWLLIGLVIYLIMLWFDQAEKKSLVTFSNDIIEIKRSQDRHYFWPGTVNGHSIEFLIDTGATITSIPQSLAKKSDLKYGPSITLQTANGNITVPTVTANLCLEGDFCISRLEMVVLPDGSNQALLGMNVISRFSWSQENHVMRFKASTSP